MYNVYRNRRKEYFSCNLSYYSENCFKTIEILAKSNDKQNEYRPSRFLTAQKIPTDSRDTLIPISIEFI